MKTSARLATALAVAAALLSSVGCNKLRARDQLNKGVQSYRSAHYEEAIDHFQRAVSLDEDFKVAKLYLAMAYTSQYVPGVETPDNLKMAQQAIGEYKSVLDKDPNSVTSLKGIAFLEREMKHFDEAREAYKKALAIDPNDPELYYSLGVIDWTEAFKDAGDIKSRAGVKVDDQLKTKQMEKVCAELKEKEGAIVDEGMKMIETAIEKRQDYDDAMVYLNLLYLRKAEDMACDDPDARAQYIKASNDWSNKAMEARKKKAEEAAKKNQGGIILEATPTPGKK
ncbi:MAG TPA: tetratricopeptide repeat protein [Candidatus Angelobacter sp.]|nr:tetratricopeptide repeat protein [Candidatus Angelobacter sp.]